MGRSALATVMPISQLQPSRALSKCLEVFGRAGTPHRDKYLVTGEIGIAAGVRSPKES